MTGEPIDLDAIEHEARDPYDGEVTDYLTPEKVNERPTVGEWGVIDNDGNRACWWCLCTVHPSVALLHDRWHLRMWRGEP